jgi:predicted membrane-bound mannosyltransferase
LTDRVKAIARVSPQGVQTEVRVVAPESEYWPLPWYLRQLRTVWWLDTLPQDSYAPIMIVAARLQAALDDKSNRRYLNVGYYELRPREFFELYVEFELWKRFVETLPRPETDE